MFDHAHYVPILRWKQAEWLALRNLLPTDKDRLTPLIEITPKSVAPGKRRTTLDEMLTKNAGDIVKNWGNSPVFLDLWYLPPVLRTDDGSHPLVFIADAAHARRASCIPVTGIDRDPQYQAAVASTASYYRRGVCIRLMRRDISRSDTHRRLQDLLSLLEVKAYPRSRHK